MISMFFITIYSDRFSGVVMNKFLFYLPMLLFAIIFGCRYGVGIDYYNYVDIYERYNSIKDYDKDMRLEPAIIAIIGLCKSLDLNVCWYFAVMSFIQIFFIYKALEDDKEVLAYAVLMLIVTGIGLSGFTNIIRQSIAFCIFVYAIKYIASKSLLQYLLLLTLAVLFHKSAILLYSIYFIYLYKDCLFSNIKLQLILFVFSIILLLVNPFQYFMKTFDFIVFSMGYEGYVGSETIDGSRNMGIMNVFEVFVYLLLILYSNKIKAWFESPIFNIMYDLCFVGICLKFVFFGSLSFERLNVYFYYFIFIVFAYFFVYLKNIKLQSYMKFVTYIFIVFYFVLSFGRIMYYSDQNTTRYVFYSQKHLHDLKDVQHMEMLNTR